MGQSAPTPRPAALAGGLATGEIAVATRINRPGLAPVTCPASPFLRKALDGSGIRVREMAFTLAPDLAAGTVSAFADFEPGAPGFAAAANHADTAALEAARAVIRAAREATRPRRVIMASPRSYCAGVERAIGVVEEALHRHGPPVYVRKQIVHNRHVVRDLEERGAVFVDELDQVPDEAIVVFSAHGVSQQVRNEGDQRQLSVIDATCPLVSKVHAEVRRFTARASTTVLIGHAGHEEVEGTLGQAPGTVLVQDLAEAERLEVPDSSKIAYVTQTTLAVDETTEIVDVLRRRFPAIQGPPSDDLCYATTNRQRALAEIATDADLVLVVGSANSSNSQRLVEVARRMGRTAYLVDGPEDVDLRWLTDATTIGLTGGASAPAALVDGIVHAFSGLGPVDVSERRVTEENIHFDLPRGVRS